MLDTCKILTVIGARPQFIKAAAVSRVLRTQKEFQEIIIHTGQHFDHKMSEIFFEELSLPKIDYNLGIGSLSHGAMTGRMLEEIEKIIFAEKPHYVMVYGDTNSTLAGALAARKSHTKLIHIEAGLRSFDMNMPEEINRILTDRVSDLLFCPTKQSVENLYAEGYKNFTCQIIKSGDVMLDAILFYQREADLLSKHNMHIANFSKDYVLCTIHRAENTDNVMRLKSIFNALNKIHQTIPVVLPLHPRTRKIIENNRIDCLVNIIEPVGYLEMISLLNNCKLVITDSGGLQKEAFFTKKFCVTLRDSTEWIELVEHGYNKLAGCNEDKIIDYFSAFFYQEKADFSLQLYGNGNASEIIVSTILKDFNSKN